MVRLVHETTLEQGVLEFLEALEGYHRTGSRFGSVLLTSNRMATFTNYGLVKYLFSSKGGSNENAMYDLKMVDSTGDEPYAVKVGSLETFPSDKRKSVELEYSPFDATPGRASSPPLKMVAYIDDDLKLGYEFFSGEKNLGNMGTISNQVLNALISR